MLIKPDNWKFFNQPPAMEEVKDKNNQVVEYKNYNQSENQNNLTQNYYRNIIFEYIY